jgi:hypothetical protein
MAVGVNYPWPWNQYGNYFGNDGLKVWLDNLDRNLAQLARIGVEVVRIFLFCNMNNVGSIAKGHAPLAPRTRWPLGLGLTPPVPVTDVEWWNFREPNPLSESCAGQLESMLGLFIKHGIQVIPSLVDALAFAMAPNGAWRTDIIAFPDKRRWFLTNVVQKLLDVASAPTVRPAVFAWEVMNEPGWITDFYYARFAGKTKYFIPEWQMRTFLRDVLDLIERAGFPSTVGHVHRGDFVLPTGTIPQFHYYPQKPSRAWNEAGALAYNLAAKMRLIPSRLPRQSAARPAFLGEFGCAYIQQDQANSAPWPRPREDASRKDDAEERVLGRLRFVGARGYGLALLWPDDTQSTYPENPSDPLKFEPGVLSAIEKYVHT